MNTITQLERQIQDAIDGNDFETAVELKKQMNVLTVNDQLLKLCLRPYNALDSTGDELNRLKEVEGFDADTTDPGGVPALFLAACHNRNTCFYLLLASLPSYKSKSYKDSHGNTLLHKYLTDPNLSDCAVKAVIESSGLDLLEKNNDGQSAVTVCKIHNPALLPTVLECLEMQISRRKAEQERQTAVQRQKLEREERDRIAREEQERVFREEQERVFREEQDRIAREQAEQQSIQENKCSDPLVDHPDHPDYYDNSDHEPLSTPIQNQSDDDNENMDRSHQSAPSSNKTGDTQRYLFFINDKVRACEEAVHNAQEALRQAKAIKADVMALFDRSKQNADD